MTKVDRTGTAPPGGQGTSVTAYDGGSCIPDATATASGFGVSLDTIVRRLFDASLSISAARELASDPVVDRLNAAVATIDELIRDVRAAAFEALQADLDTTVIHLGDVMFLGPPGGDPASDLVGRLEKVTANLADLGASHPG